MYVFPRTGSVRRFNDGERLCVGVSHEDRMECAWDGDE